MRVLIVDDEDIIRQGVRILLEKCHHAVEIVGEAAHGREALAIIEAQKPDLLIADIQMPVMDGMELMRELFPRYPDMVKVILTGHADFEYARQALQYGVTEYILKPVTQVKINEVVNGILTNNPARWLDGIDVARLKEMKELANALVKAVLAEEKDRVTRLIDDWRGSYDGRPPSLHEWKQMIGVLRLTFQTEMFSRYADPLPVDTQWMEAGNTAELIGNWTAELLRMIDEITQKRVPRNKRVVQFVISLIEQEYGNPELTIRDLADRAGISASYLSKMFRDLVHQPFTYYLSEYRLAQVKRRLDEGEETLLGEIAEQCGFSDYPYFSKVFKKQYGMSPQEYREKSGEYR
ncbi:response regulator transcription factor [Paenibacillus sp. 1P07SE]|uniref:response regulator transcription factor n=1 Tax=Paenibacillus sp. 1P07SE TaxID=3132209 RepID=UPI0039A4ADC3